MKRVGGPVPGEKGRLEIAISIEGMSCAACARRVEKALSKTAGVSDAGVNFATGKATVEYDPAVVSPGELVGAVEDAGYGVLREGEETVEGGHEREYRKLRGRF